jgi:hypothetical protein
LSNNRAIPKELRGKARQAHPGITACPVAKQQVSVSGHICFQHLIARSGLCPEDTRGVHAGMLFAVVQSMEMICCQPFDIMKKPS